MGIGFNVKKKCFIETGETKIFKRKTQYTQKLILLETEKKIILFSFNVTNLPKDNKKSINILYKKAVFLYGNFL